MNYATGLATRLRGYELLRKTILSPLFCRKVCHINNMKDFSTDKEQLATVNVLRFGFVSNFKANVRASH